MPDKHLHIVSFDIPFPPDYGGVIDVFYKIKALYQQEVKVHLHCFEYGRSHSKELERFCESVFYYKRKSGLSYFFSLLPYIAVTRCSEALMNNLLQDDYPILFEGLHCCFHLNDARLRSRIKIVRAHNIEQDYYSHLAKAEKNICKKYYFSREAKKLKLFEPVFKNANYIAAISKGDAVQLSERYSNVSHVAAFHPDNRCAVKGNRGNFVLYHGNMGVGENNAAALFLVRNVFSDTTIPFVIAGNNPSAQLIEEAKKYPNIQIKENIRTEKIYELIRDAQINILPTFQSTGIKLKLLAALFNGRHCIVNTPMVANTGLNSLCVITDSAGEMKEEVARLFEKDFDASEIKKREEILLRNFSNKETAKRLARLVWNQ